MFRLFSAIFRLNLGGCIYLYIHMFSFTFYTLTTNLMWMRSRLLRHCYIQGVPGGKVNILGGHSIGHYKQKTYMYMCPIPNGFRDRDISLYNCLNLALSSVLSSRRTAPLSKACVYQASVDCCNWPMWRPSSIVQNAVHLHKCWIY